MKIFIRNLRDISRLHKSQSVRKTSNIFVWTAQGTFSFDCDSYPQSLAMDLCSLDFGIMDVNMAGLMAIGFIPEEIWL